jgi:hypothetical protein
LPTLWFRNTWTWWPERGRPSLRAASGAGGAAVAAAHTELGDYFLYCDGDPPLLFTENDPNNERIFGTPNTTAWVKDAFDNYVVHGRRHAVNADASGTKTAAHYRLDIAAGATRTIRLRLVEGGTASPFGPDFADVLELRRAEADAFYRALAPPSMTADAANVMRQAFAGMLWSKQYFSKSTTPIRC